MQIRNLRISITGPSPPTLAEIEQQREDPLAQADLPSQHATSSPAPDPASLPITGLPSPEPLPPSSGCLTRQQIRRLFHGHVSGSSVAQTLEKLSSLGNSNVSLHLWPRSPHHRLARHRTRMRGADGRRGRRTRRILGGSRLTVLTVHILAISRTGFPPTQRWTRPCVRLSVKLTTGFADPREDETV
jgi:hypothetical protein